LAVGRGVIGAQLPVPAADADVGQIAESGVDVRGVLGPRHHPAQEKHRPEATHVVQGYGIPSGRRYTIPRPKGGPGRVSYMPIRRKPMRAFAYTVLALSVALAVPASAQDKKKKETPLPADSLYKLQTKSLDGKPADLKEYAGK